MKSIQQYINSHYDENEVMEIAQAFIRMYLELGEIEFGVTGYEVVKECYKENRKE